MQRRKQDRRASEFQPTQAMVYAMERVAKNPTKPNPNDCAMMGIYAEALKKQVKPS